MRLAIIGIAALAAVLGLSGASAQTEPPKPRVVYTVGGEALAADAEATVSTLRARLETLGLEPKFSSSDGQLKILVVRPDDLEAVATVITTPGVFTIHAAGEIVQTCPADVPQGMVCMPTIEPKAPFVIVASEPVLSGDVIEKAVPITGEGVVPQVAINMTRPASEIFAQFTKAMVGQRIAIAVDGRIITAPRIQSPITSGAGVLAGPGIPAATWATVLTHPPLRGPLTVLSVEEAPAR